MATQKKGFVWGHHRQIIRAWEKLLFPLWQFIIYFVGICIVFLCLPVGKYIPALFVANICGVKYWKQACVGLAFYFALYNITVHFSPEDNQFDARKFDQLFEDHHQDISPEVVKLFEEEGVVKLPQIFGMDVLKQYHRIVSTKLETNQPYSSPERIEYANWFDVELVRQVASEGADHIARQLLQSEHINFLGDVYTIRKVNNRQAGRYFRDTPIFRTVQSGSNAVAIFCPTTMAEAHKYDYYHKDLKLRNCNREKTEEKKELCRKQPELNKRQISLSPGDCVAYTADTIFSNTHQNLNEELESFTLYYAEYDSLYRGFYAVNKNIHARHAWCKHNLAYGQPLSTSSCFPLVGKDLALHIPNIELHFPINLFRLNQLFWYLQHINSWDFILSLVGHIILSSYFFGLLWLRLSSSFVKKEYHNWDTKKRS